MDTSFSIKRVGMLLRNDVRRHAKNLYTLFGILLALYLLKGFFDGLISLRNADSLLITYIGAAVFFVPFCYRHLFDTVKGVQYAMLPANQSEKFAAMFLFSVVLFPLALSLFALLVMLPMAVITGDAGFVFDLSALFTPSESVIWGFYPSFLFFEHTGFFGSIFWKAVTMQSFIFWGVCFFKKHKLRNSLLCMLGFFMLMGIFFNVGLTSWQYSYHNMLPEQFATLTNRIGFALWLMFCVLLPIALWVFSFFKIRRQQF